MAKKNTKKKNNVESSVAVAVNTAENEQNAVTTVAETVSVPLPEPAVEMVIAAIEQVPTEIPSTAPQVTLGENGEIEGKQEEAASVVLISDAIVNPTQPEAEVTPEPELTPTPQVSVPTPSVTNGREVMGVKFPDGEFSKRDVERVNNINYIEASTLVNFLVKNGMLVFVRKQPGTGRGKPTDIFNLAPGVN